MVAGRKYEFGLIGARADPDGNLTLSDPKLFGIYDADGNLISGTTANDDNNGDLVHSQYTATVDGPHYYSVGAEDFYEVLVPPEHTESLSVTSPFPVVIFRATPPPGKSSSRTGRKPGAILQMKTTATGSRLSSNQGKPTGSTSGENPTTSTRIRWKTPTSTASTTATGL